LLLNADDIPVKRKLIQVYIQMQQWQAAEDLAHELIKTDDELIGRFVLGNI
jgi:lipopolysaccharide biosynthesis regulator YciM